MWDTFWGDFDVTRHKNKLKFKFKKKEGKPSVGLRTWILYFHFGGVELSHSLIVNKSETWRTMKGEEEAT